MRQESFFVAGIGASAVGHQVLKEFFINLPEKPGIAFCVVTDLLRGCHNILDKIISRYSMMPVHWMKSLDIVQPNHVYIMPEGMKAYMRNGCVVLKERAEEEIANTTVDEFFISLADDQREKAIGIVLSGMGDDGARGVEVIHEAGGMGLVQESQTMAFKALPGISVRHDHSGECLPPAILARNIMTHVAQKKETVYRSYY